MFLSLINELHPISFRLAHLIYTYSLFSSALIKISKRQLRSNRSIYRKHNSQGEPEKGSVLVSRYKGAMAVALYP